MDETPVAEHARIASLDVLRGFALLGILLLNIVGFGLPSAAYSYPPMGFIAATDPYVWAGVELFAEGAMRCLFSILFGIGCAIQWQRNVSQGSLFLSLWYRRMATLLIIGLVHMYDYNSHFV